MLYASKAIIIKDTKYLLQLRDNKKDIFSPNCWTFFGGRIKKKESAEMCLVRELREELSINIKIIMKIYESFNHKTNSYVNYYYAKPLNKINVKNLTEGQSLGWFKKNQINNLKKAQDLKTFLNFLN